MVAAAGTVPDWSLLHWFGYAAIASAVIVAVTYLVWAPKAFWGPLVRPLILSDPKWTFKDSWASNATVAATLLAAFFGSTDILKQVFGDSAASVTTTIAVAAAIATSLTVSAPLILAATARNAGNTVGGFLLAAIVTMTGVGGQLAVIVQSARRLDFGGFQDWLPWIGLIAGILLAIYAVTSIPRVLAAALEKPAAASAAAAAVLRLEGVTATQSLLADTIAQAARQSTPEYHPVRSPIL